MECRKLELTLISADNLPDVRSLGLMQVYAKVSLSGSEKKTTQKTPVDRHGETNPRWHFPVAYTINESTVRKPGVNLIVELFCKRTLGDRFIGKVEIQVKSLFEMGLKAQKILSYNVAGTPGGKLNVLYSFGEKVLVRTPSGRKSKIGLGFLVLIGGALILLGRESDSDDGYGDADGARKSSRVSMDVDFDEFDDGECYYDVID